LVDVFVFAKLGVFGVSWVTNKVSLETHFFCYPMQNLVKTLILSIPVGVTVIDVLGYIARVDGESMSPTLNPQKNDSEYVFLNKVRNYLNILGKVYE
jgi:signal peptidase I